MRRTQAQAPTQAQAQAQTQARAPETTVGWLAASMWYP
jgi:hypothetical protein